MLKREPFFFFFKTERKKKKKKKEKKENQKKKIDCPAYSTVWQCFSPKIPPAA